MNGPSKRLLAIMDKDEAAPKKAARRGSVIKPKKKRIK